MHRPRTEDIADELGIPVQDVNYIINMSSGPLPLEPADDGRGDGETVRHVYEDYTYNPERDLFRRYLREGTRNFLKDRLQERERQVLSYRYRLDNDTPYTLKEIGDKLNLSPETIRQIEMKAMEKIRKNVRELRNSGLLEAI
jgi:RNA polymerase primary sigma factor